MRYFLTGATGFIGGRLARLLIDSGHEVTALVRDPAKAAPLAGLGVRLVKPPSLHPGPAVIRALSGFMGIVEAVVPLPPAYASETLRVMAGVTYLGDSSKAKRELGFETRPLQEGLRETLRHEMRILGME